MQTLEKQTLENKLGIKPDNRIVQIHPDILYAGDDGSFDKFHERYFDIMNRIELCSELNVQWYPENKKDKEILSYFGMAFMLNKPVRLLNREQIQPTPHKSYTNVLLSIDEISSRGDFLPDVNRKIEKDTTYIICTVRNTTEEDQKVFKKYAAKLEALGMNVHLPDPNADYQKDPNGLNICLRHRQETASSRDVRTFWNPTSEGSVFDLACTIIASKPIKLVKMMPYKGELDAKSKNFMELVQLCNAVYDASNSDDSDD